MTEAQRPEFLSLLPDEVRRQYAIFMDASVSTTLNQGLIEKGQDEEKQRKEVRLRAFTELRQVLADQKTTDRKIAAALARSFSNLGGDARLLLLELMRDEMEKNSNPEVKGDALIVLSYRSRVQYYALEAGTGKVLWLGQPRQARNTAVVKAGDLLFLLNDDGQLIVAKNSRTGLELLKQYTVADSATWAQPTISGNRLFIKDVSSLTLWTVY
jgi:hypothetical protein